MRHAARLSLPFMLYSSLYASLSFIYSASVYVVGKRVVSGARPPEFEF